MTTTGTIGRLPKLEETLSLSGYWLVQSLTLTIAIADDSRSTTGTRLAIKTENGNGGS